MSASELKRISNTIWEIPKRGMMRVPGRVVADERLMQNIAADETLEQVANVACLPGITGYSWAMPDAHVGYGFPIGGVAAMDPEEDGVISPGGVGYDINCGCRVMTTSLAYHDVRDRMKDMVEGLYKDIPCGVGSAGAIPKLSKRDMHKVLTRGAEWALEQGYGEAADLDTTEEQGCLSGADPEQVSERAKSRGESQLGTLGSGNHFVELGVIERVFDAETAQVYGLEEGRLTLMIHSGSRGLGYQVCDDFLQVMVRAAAKYGVKLPDRQLCCAPIHSSEGRKYLAAMAAAANYAWANRQIMMELARRSLQRTLGMDRASLGGKLLYDVCHNIAKLEVHEVDGKRKRLCVHRKGATRAFPGSRQEVPPPYRAVGQPVLVPGDMGTGSLICAGTEGALSMTYGSSVHGAGRLMSRNAARKAKEAGVLMQELTDRDVVVMARNRRVLAEEMPDAYKDIDAVGEVLEEAGIGRRVARTRPVGVVKG